MTREAASVLVRRVEQRTSPRMLAYDFVASRIGRSTTWVRQFVRNGIGSVSKEVGDAIDALLIRELQAEAIRLEHELEMARQSGAHPAAQHVAEVETHLARIRTLLRI